MIVVLKKDSETIYTLLEKHVKYTESTVAKAILDHWDEELKKFIRVMPLEYKRVLEKVEIEAIKIAEEETSDG